MQMAIHPTAQQGHHCPTVGRLRAAAYTLTSTANRRVRPIPVPLPGQHFHVAVQPQTCQACQSPRNPRRSRDVDVSFIQDKYAESRELSSGRGVLPSLFFFPVLVWCVWIGCAAQVIRCRWKLHTTLGAVSPGIYFHSCLQLHHASSSCKSWTDSPR
ncbi:uncharacterized protein BCR38DRAFT_443449 [Pseudomassariella vexata]|uniref:Uncharacterized protein n=1 Tax=Pseudomassariella vexata TaxID=1141098 RepID=A0A1Y2DL58_9PEZI|nr:uncharacterized protein BCR38DRAFT_443449 [Pseudomassariella vexata]ORY59951.1 hypothetical protein BCR38DRAFT_443449 [Pseudomassariella vexata]